LQYQQQHLVDVTIVVSSILVTSVLLKQWAKPAISTILQQAVVVIKLLN
jgi:hypothetical protein